MKSIANYYALRWAAYISAVSSCQIINAVYKTPKIDGGQNKDQATVSMSSLEWK